MARSVTEWIGKTDDTPIPLRVRLRRLEAAGAKCADCKSKLGPRNPPEYDHVISLINGGENRETNIQCLCKACHRFKTKQDVAVKKKNNSVRASHHGLKESKFPMPGGRGSKYKRKIGGPTVLREEE